MQNVFAERTPWHTPWMERVLPVVRRIAERRPERTIFTRFIPPQTPEDTGGAWRRYYQRWRDLTRDRIDPRLLDIVPPLAKLAPPAVMLDKNAYSAFSTAALDAELGRRRADTVVVTGAETDVCVLSSVLDAVDRGLRVIVVTDAICSSSDETHDALLKLYCGRYSQQIETATADVVLAAWED